MSARTPTSGAGAVTVTEPVALSFDGVASPASRVEHLTVYGPPGGFAVQFGKVTVTWADGARLCYEG